jgi:8-oxo-dGTP diphosphatase
MKEGVTAVTETSRPRTRVRVAGILVDDSRVLMESMADRELWGVPGGGLEEGESLTAGCVREYLEELGLTVAAGRLALVTDHFFIDGDGLDRHVICFYFIVSADLAEARAVLSNEPHLQFRWLDLGDLASHEVIPAHLCELLPAAIAAPATVYAFDDERMGKTRFAGIVGQVSEDLAGVEDLLAELLRVADSWPQAQFGVYLHGSRARGEARADSDVDVIALAHPSTPAEVIQEFLTAGRSCQARLAERLDLKAFTTTRFAADPWVKLHRARFAGGRDWRPELPRPTFDELAREALGVFRVVAEDDDLSRTDAAGIRKILAWMATVVAGHTTGIAPASGTEARNLLRENRDPLGLDIEALLHDLEATPAVTDLTHYRDRAHALQDRVVGFLLDQLHTGKLGRRCAEMASGLAESMNRA